jgi:MarR family transcriptional regulator, temperature-dependent positive regulator of motility
MNLFLSLLHRANQIATECYLTSGGRPGATTARQVQLLAAIDASHCPSQTALVVSTGIDRTTVTNVIRRLETQRLIERSRSIYDGRAYEVRLTDEGRAALASGAPILAQVESQLLEELPTAERSQLLSTLAKIVRTYESRALAKSIDNSSAE